MENQQGTGSRRSNHQAHTRVPLPRVPSSASLPLEPGVRNPQATLEGGGVGGVGGEGGGGRREGDGGNIVFIDLTTTSLPQSAQASILDNMTNLQDDSHRTQATGGGGITGVARIQGPLDPPPPVRATVLNSRYKRRLGFNIPAKEVPQAAPPMPFVSPSTIQPASRGPATPTTARGPLGPRQRQFKPQTSKPAAALSSSKRDARPKPYSLEVPSMAPIYPNNSMILISSYDSTQCTN